MVGKLFQIKGSITLTPRKFVSQVVVLSCASVCGHILRGQKVTERQDLPKAVFKVP